MPGIVGQIGEEIARLKTLEAYPMHARGPADTIHMNSKDVERMVEWVKKLGHVSEENAKWDREGYVGSLYGVRLLSTVGIQEGKAILSKGGKIVAKVGYGEQENE